MIASFVSLTLGVLAVLAASAAEAAAFALPLTDVESFATQRRRGARSLASLRSRPAALLSTLWTLRVTGAALSALAGWGLAAAFGVGLAVRVLAVALAVALVVIAEFAGKLLGQRRPERWSLWFAGSLRLLSQIMLPITWAAERMWRSLVPKPEEILPGILDHEIRDIVSPSAGGPVIEEHERRLIERAMLLDETTAYDIMTPRVDIVAWPETKTLAEIAPELRVARYSRVPLYNESIDQITGVLYSRDAYQALISGQRDVQLKALAREPFFVPGSITLDRLLLDFQVRRIHMGIVIDEYGGVDGLVALEDILEELVGEIVDESDIAVEPIIRLSRNEILVDGGADLREINHFFNTTFPQLEHRSLNGYLLDVLGRVPIPGEKITAEGVVIEVTAATDTQVLRARLSHPPQRASQEEKPADSAAVGPAGESGPPQGVEGQQPSTGKAAERQPGR